ncbi:hypothetical protein GGX14DRAFT_367375 [Mycena pura]|uniref:DUF6589 domain-containing protein n=1 Tax=Mycena pura TaxID=153505 RepID=A0AAD6VCY0_9AGAR|nr:hypothetical protein GGX14DRAFT_367375 [Mycena pura]
MTPDSVPRTFFRRNDAIESRTSLPIPSSSTILNDNDPFDSAELPDSSSDYCDQELDGLSLESLPFRRRRSTDTYTKIHTLLAELRRDRISPVDILIQVLDPRDISYDRYRGNLYRDDSTKLAQLIEQIMLDYNGKKKLMHCMDSHLMEYACEKVADEMVTRRKKSTLQGINAVTPAFIEAWNLDEEKDCSPFLTNILETAAQTDRAKAQNKKKRPEKMCQVITQQVLYQSSNRCLAFQAAFGLFLWATGCAKQTIDALFRCGLSVCYDGVLNHLETLADYSMEEAIEMAKKPHGFGYDNMNLSSSIFVEQRGAAGPAKVASGTFGLLYGLRNAKHEHMLIAPIMRRFKAATGLQFNRDIRPSLHDLGTFQDQLIITTIHSLASFVDGFEYVLKEPNLQHKPIRPIPVGYKTPYKPTRASTIEEATTRDNLLYHDEIYINQLGQSPESLSVYAIPSFHDQLTNSRIRSAQLLRAQDVNAWERREVFQLGFGLFHLCLNLVWAILHTHRGSVNDAGSLSYFFALMEKARLGNDQPDYHSLLAALTQVLNGTLLNAWLRECGFPSFKAFADSKPSPLKLREIAAQILLNYATPIPTANIPEPQNTQVPDEDSDSESTDSGCDSESENPPPSSPPNGQPHNPKDDIAHQNIRLLTRDLLMVIVLVRAISDGDIGRVEPLLPHLAMMFRGSGCNKYCTEILHFLQNLKHIWTPEFADIMRDNMIICISGGGPGHCMAIDLNIEHLIGYLKNLLKAKGMSSTWDRLGNISAAIAHIQAVKKKIAAVLDGAYKSTGHTTPDTSHLVWRVQQKIADEGLHEFEQGRSNNEIKKLTANILERGEAKLKSSTLATFNKKTMAMIAGHAFEEEEDECPAMSFATAALPEEYT